MSTLEREIIEKFHQLDREAQQRVRDLIVQETEATAFDYHTWFHDLEALRLQIRASHGNTLPPIDVISILRDIRNGEDE